MTDRSETINILYCYYEYDSMHSTGLHHQVSLLTHNSPSPLALANPSPFSLPLFLSLPLFPFPSLLLFPLKQSNCLQHSWESPTLSDADQAATSQSLFSTTTVNTSRGSRSHWNLLLTLVCGCLGVCTSVDVHVVLLKAKWPYLCCSFCDNTNSLKSYLCMAVCVITDTQE